MNRIAICTIFAKNYLSHARVLAESFLRQHSGGKVYGLLCDDQDGYFNPDEEPFTLVTLADLDIPNLEEMIFKYDIVELSTAVKPFLLRYLFATQALDKLCYFDPDILFLAPIDEIDILLEKADIVIVPHLTDTLKEDVIPSERHIMMTGIYNLGFIGLRRSSETDKFLNWWGEKLVTFCYADPGNGLYVDQRWIDLVPGTFDRVHVHRDPGCDIAYWNMTQRTVVRQGTHYTCLGSRVKFFHFSGYSPADPSRISKRVSPSDTRLAMSQIGDCAELFEQYRMLLLEHGFETTSKWPYALGRFSNGVPVPQIARNMWKEATANGLRWENLLKTECTPSFYQWLQQPLDESPPLITRVARRVYEGRIDVQKAFPDIQAANRREFVRWFVETGIIEHNIPTAFADAMRQSLITSAPPIEKRMAATRPVLTRLYTTPLAKQAMTFTQTRVGRAIRRVIYPPAQISATATTNNNGQMRRHPRRDGLNLIGYLSAETGVGEVPRALGRALSARGYPVAITHLANADGARRNDLSALGLPTGTPYDINLFTVNADGIANVKQMLGNRLLRDRYNIAFWFWEIARFPDSWRDRFNDLQEIWVGSSFVHEAVAAVSPVPVVKMGVPIVLQPPSAVTRAELGLPEGKFIFLFAFDMLSIPDRKNPLDCIAAYRHAFEPLFRDTHLVIKANHLHYFPDWQVKLRREVQAVQGSLIEATLDRTRLNALFQLADAYVSLHRSEGFGLTLAESMRMGKPVIATDYSGNRDFLTGSNGFPVRYTLVQLEHDYGPYQADNVWAQPDVEHAASLMRYVLDHPDESGCRAQQAMYDIEAMYGAQAIATRITQRLDHLRER
jgi:glycosyltransferase involved in cell wall biosynthesis